MSLLTDAIENGKVVDQLALDRLASEIVDKILTESWFMSMPDAVDEVITHKMWETHSIDITALVEAIKAQMVKVINGIGESDIFAEED